MEENYPQLVFKPQKDLNFQDIVNHIRITQIDARGNTDIPQTLESQEVIKANKKKLSW